MKIKIEIQGKERELTLDEAKAIYSELHQLFAEKETVYVPSPYPIYPTYPNPTITWVSQPTIFSDGSDLLRSSTCNGITIR